MPPQGNQSSSVPPLPPGYQLDAQQQGGGPPPLPPGYSLDSAPAQPAAPQYTISAQHEPDSLAGKVTQWAGDLGNDLRYGTENTAPGRLLHKMGARGLESGTSPETANWMGSVPLGATRMLQGGGEIGQGDLWRGGKDVVGGAAQVARIPSSFVAPEAGEAAADALEAGGNAAAEQWQRFPGKRIGGTLWAAAKGGAAKVPVVGPVAKGAIQGGLRYWKASAPAADELESVGSQRLIEAMGGKPISAATQPSGRLVLSEAEAQAENQQMSLAKKIASQRGMQYAAGMKPN